MVRSHGGGARPANGPARPSDVAADAARLLLGLDPVLGDHATQVAVDAFVERAADALRAVAAAEPDGIPEHPGPRPTAPR